LIETVVTVGLLAVLAAFVVPTVIQKAGACDPVKVQNDVAAVGTAIEEFANDTKGAFPNQLHELTNKINSTMHEIDSVTFLDSAQVLVWNGPYLAVTADTIPSDSIATGYTAWIKNYIVRYDADHNAAHDYVAGTGTGGTYDSTATIYAALTITGLSLSQAENINTMINGPNANNKLVPSPGTYALANKVGLFRWDKPDSTNHVVAYYLAVPIVP
jgi:type II secretory pathway pseudopilin PulG